MEQMSGIYPTRSWYILAVVIAVTFAASINRQILFLIIEPLKAELALSDADIGILTGLAPGILAGGGALLLGWLTDRYQRHILLGVCILAWSVATAFLGVAYSFVGFLIGVLALALGETALAPVSNSLIPDIFSGARRIQANLLLFTAGGISVGIGAAASGALLSWVQTSEFTLLGFSPDLVYWRTAFELVAMAGIPVAILAFSIGRLERRKNNFNGAADYRSLSHYAQDHWIAASGLSLAIALISSAGLAVMAWTPTYVIRVYAVSPAEAGFALGLTSTIATLAGVCTAALLIRKLLPRFGTLAARYLFQYSILLTMVPTLLHLLATTTLQVYSLFGVQIMLASIGTALSSTMLQDISPAKYRGRLFGIHVLLVTIVSSLAPWIVGFISDQFGPDPKGLLKAIVLFAVPAMFLAVVSVGTTNRQYAVTTGKLAHN